MVYHCSADRWLRTRQTTPLPRCSHYQFRHFAIYMTCSRNAPNITQVQYQSLNQRVHRSSPCAPTIAINWLAAISSMSRPIRQCSRECAPRQEAKPSMETELDPLTITNSSQHSVRLRTSDRRQPIIVVVERSAIDDYFPLSTSTDQQRWDIIQANLAATSQIANERYRQRTYTMGQSAGPKFIQIVIRSSDLSSVELTMPEHR